MCGTLRQSRNSLHAARSDLPDELPVAGLPTNMRRSKKGVLIAINHKHDDIRI